MAFIAFAAFNATSDSIAQCVQPFVRRCSDSKLALHESFLGPFVEVIAQGNRESLHLRTFMGGMKQLRVRKWKDDTFEYDFQVLRLAMQEFGCFHDNQQWNDVMAKVGHGFLPPQASEPTSGQPQPLVQRAASEASEAGVVVQIPSKPKSPYHALPKGVLVSKLVKLEESWKSRVVEDRKIRQ